MPYNMNDEHVCNDCGVRLVECDMCECCGACCDCDEGDPLPDLPMGGFYDPCCPEWATNHVVPIYRKGEVIRWDCSHCGGEHFVNAKNEWDDNIPF